MVTGGVKILTKKIVESGHEGSHSLQKDELYFDSDAYVKQVFRYKNDIAHPVLQGAIGLFHMFFNGTYVVRCKPNSFPVHHEFIVIEYFTGNNDTPNARYLGLSLNMGQGEFMLFRQNATFNTRRISYARFPKKKHVFLQKLQYCEQKITKKKQKHNKKNKKM